ncbi:MAG: 4-alpha-glucanotransferase [Thermoanaerobaculia bacterium]
MSERTAGLLLHPTSLPGRYAIGDLGPEAERFLAWARDAGQSWWQILPLGPPERGNSPYTALSAFAGNPLLISPDLLIREGLLAAGDVAEVPALSPAGVDFEQVIPWKERLLRRSWELFERRATPTLRAELRGFAEAPAQQAWLDDWALFSALRIRHRRRGWWKWPPALAHRDASALTNARRAESREVDFQRYVQFLFRRQWSRLRRIAAGYGIRLFGDLPIYVALDSADVWVHRELFDLDEEGRPRAVAGVPPDAYSETGQLWGNPLYRWDQVASEGYRWWIERVRANLELCDRLRIDHFRGFVAYWRVPAGAETAAVGEWVDGPGRRFFDALRGALGRPSLEDLPLVAEDLGVITPDVEALRRKLGLPGMKVLHFAFGEDDSEHLPDRFEPACVVYTGTHDNDTTVGWYQSLDDEARRRHRRYTGAAADVHWTLIELAYESVAETAMVPVQDVLGLDREARMNTPAVAEGNWSWRLRESQLTPELARRLRALVESGDRSPSGE